jgi:predicted PurR-regulated permease PerM
VQVTDVDTHTPTLPRAALILIGAAAVVIVIAGMKASASILGPTFLALMLAVAVHPLQDRLRRKGVPTWAAIVIALALVYSALAALLVALGLSLVRFAAILPDYRAKFDELITQGRGLLESMGVSQQQVQQALNVDPNRVFSVLGPLLGGTIGVVSALTLVATLVLFMVVDGTGYTRRMTSLERQRPGLVTALTSFSQGTRKYLVVSTVFGLIVAVLDTTALWLLGVPLPLLWGLLAFITNYIPNIGFVLGLVPPALLGLLEGGPVTMLVVVAVYSVINFVVQTVIQPKVVGDSAGLSVTVAMAALIFWGWVLGPLGALLAIPLTLLAKALLVDVDPSARWVNTFLADRVPDT